HGDGAAGEETNTTRVIRGIEEFIAAVREDSSTWKPEEPRWFRGEPVSTTALVPTLYRQGHTQHENALLQMFRARASGYHDVVPIREHTDQWLFLATRRSGTKNPPGRSGVQVNYNRRRNTSAAMNSNCWSSSPTDSLGKFITAISVR